jgi:catechol 2,3-dioxygenase-like lactoylglutathione lyase family enzyme
VVSDIVRRLSHLGICVSDLERSVAFYRDALGFTAIHELRVEGEPSDSLLRLRGVRLNAVYLERDGLRIELLHYESPRSPETAPARAMNDLGFTHLSVIVADIDEALARLEEAGARIDRDTRIEIGGRIVAAMVRDPDGLRIELVLRDPTGSTETRGR